MAQAEARAARYLKPIDSAAKEAGVVCDKLTVTGEHPFEEIIDTARTRHCDLIVMCSHGRSAAQGRLLGSQTQKVLAYSQLPVLVLR